MAFTWTERDQAKYNAYKLEAEKYEALEKQVEELNSKLIRVRDYATHRKEYSSNMRAILELLKNKDE